MKDQENYLDKIEAIIQGNAKYKFESYSFVLAALHHTVASLNNPRHITGKELLEGVREYALQQYGRMARTVLNYWGINATRDVGEIVFALVDAGVLRKQPDDKIEDFDKVYDFEKVFDQGFEIKDE